MHMALNIKEWHIEKDYKHGTIRNQTEKYNLSEVQNLQSHEQYRPMTE